MENFATNHNLSDKEINEAIIHKYGNRVNAENKALLSRNNRLSTLIQERVVNFRNKELTNIFQSINMLTRKNRSCNFVLTKNKKPIYRKSGSPYGIF